MEKQYPKHIFEFTRVKNESSKVISGQSVILKNNRESNCLAIHDPDLERNSILGYGDYPKLSAYIAENGKYQALIKKCTKEKLIIEVFFETPDQYQSIPLPIYTVKPRTGLSRAVDVGILIIIIVILLIIKAASDG